MKNAKYSRGIIHCATKCQNCRFPDDLKWVKHLQVFRLWDLNGLQGYGGYDHVASLSYPALSRPVEAGPLHPWRLQLRETWRVQVQLGKLEGDGFGSFVKAAEGSGHPVRRSGLEWWFSGSDNVVVSSPIKAFVLRKVWSWIWSWHPHFDGFSEVGVTEDLLFPGGVVGPGHARGVELLCSRFCTKVNTNTHIWGSFPATLTVFLSWFYQAKVLKWRGLWI